MLSKETPMMAQYKQIKKQHQDCILMYRLGDFYEMFFDDAILAAKILQITLTSRNRNEEMKIPMCGVPYHAVANYIAKLTRSGKKVALCDQITEPNGKGIVMREVVRIITPGTTFDENILDQKANNFVTAIVSNKDTFGFAFADVTTGDFKVTQLANSRDLFNELARLQPAECVCNENLLAHPEFKNFKISNQNMHFFPNHFQGDGEQNLKDNFQISGLEAFGIGEKKLAVEGAAMLLNYLKETQKTELQHIKNITYYEVSDFMPLDEMTIRNLELFFTSKEGKKEGSLLWLLDNTETAMGGRMLKQWLIHPLKDQQKINMRLDRVDYLKKNSHLLRELRANLSHIYDVERLLAKLSLGTGNARDLLAMRFSFEKMPQIKHLINDARCLKEVTEDIGDFEKLRIFIGSAIVDEPAATIHEGGMIKKGFHTELDALKNISSEGKGYIQNLQTQEIKRTGINSLKIRFNKIFGYYIEISKTNLNAVPENYIRKQTLVNAERFITPELKEYEEKVLNAEENIKKLEYEIFYEVRMAVLAEIKKIKLAAKALGELDVLASMAFLAEKNGYAKPEMKMERILNLQNCRHPVIEAISENFVPNDCLMDENNSCLLITGPNMGGKSTYLRQIALIVLMAHIGSFVPAEKAQIGLTDRIFTRVGAADNLVKGQSTFMVEMQETAYILHHATANSLIILDEIGRGTSTYDGVSIAWALLEYLHDEIGAFTLFATHYHELIGLAKKLKKAENFSVLVKENEREGVVFLYKVVKGGVDKSYGIEVAKLAGVPVEIIQRARGVLNNLEFKLPENSQQASFFEV